MAPKGSSYVSSVSSSVSGCGHCTAPLELIGYNWSDAKTNALFAFQIIAALVLIGCLVLSARFKWARKTGSRDHLRRFGYVFATITLWIYFVLRVIDTALQETEASVTYLFYIIYILEAAAYRISDVAILAVIIRTLYENSTSTVVKLLPTLNIVSTTILAILGTAVWVIYAVSMSSLIDNGYSFLGLLDRNGGYVNFAYDFFYLIVTILAMVYAILLFVKERTKGALIMLTVVAPAIFLRILFDLAGQGADSFRSGHSSASIAGSKGIEWANVFIYVLCSMPIFLGVAFIGCISPTSENPTTGHQKPAAYNGPPNAYQPTAPVYYNGGAPNTYQGGPVYYNNGAPMVIGNELPANYNGASPVSLQEAPANHPLHIAQS